MISSIRIELSRDATPSNYIGNRLTLGEGLHIDEERPLRNPLFTFMVFVDSTKFELTDAIRTLYRDTPPESLPTVVCLLDTGGIAWTEVSRREDGLWGLEATRLWPELHVDEKHCWSLLTFGEEDGKDGDRCGAQFGFLYYTLIQALTSIYLMPPRFSDYFDGAFRLAAGETISVDESDEDQLLRGDAADNPPEAR